MPSRIVVVEDDQDLAELLSYHLRKEGFETYTCLRGAQLLELDVSYDLAILDVMLPDLDGFRIAQILKSSERFKDIPIIFLTAKDLEMDKLRGFALGADDYVTKPFSMRELIARVRAVLRRAGALEKPTIYRLENLELDIQKREVKLRGKEINLTPTEFAILCALFENLDRPVSREYLIEKVLKRDLFDRTIDVHIKKLREKLEEFGPRIKTVRGFGYRLQA
ncbi:MAG: response regulator transcription factor [Aquificaceae bacterium]